MKGTKLRPFMIFILLLLVVLGLFTSAVSAQSGLTAADLGTSYFLTVSDFETTTGATMTYSQAPMLDALVQSGELPPLEQRLPDDPEVVVPESMGAYGGVWHDVDNHPRFRTVAQDFLTDGFTQYTRDATTIRYNLVTDIGFADDGATVILTFRKGVKWSDGTPFTSEDIRFAWEDIINDPDYNGKTTNGDTNYPVNGLQAMQPTFAYNVDGSPSTLEVVDDHTVAFHFKEPHFAAQWQMNWWLQGYEALLRSKHYLSQFHPKYNPDEKDYNDLAKNDRIFENVDYPVLWAWRPIETTVGSRMVMERNPYYWKVDTAGHQLPYIDRVEIDVVEDNQVRLLKVLNGEYDATFRGAQDPNNLSLFREKEAEGVIHPLMWGSVGGFPIYEVNQTFNADATGDTFMRGMLRNHDFMCAISESLDRTRIDAVVNNGMGEVGQATLPPNEIVFQGDAGQQLLQEWRDLCAAYDPDYVNATLDSLGLDKRDAEGFRLRPDGTPLTIVVDGYPMGNPKLDNDWPLLFKESLENVGLRVQYNSYASTQWAQVVDRARQGLVEITLNDIYAMPAGNPLSFPDYLFPVAGLADGRNWVRLRMWLYSNGAQGEAPEAGSPEEQLINLWKEATSVPTLEEAIPFMQQAIRIHIQYGPFIGGLAGNTPELVIIKTTFHNVPEYGILDGWIPQGAAYTDPEQFFIQ